MNGNNSDATPLGWTQTTLEAIRLDSSTSVNPSMNSEASFELYSVPSFEFGKADIRFGHEIGSSKRSVIPGTVLLCKINPRINRVWVVSDRSAYPQIASTEWIPFFPVVGVVPEYLRYFLMRNEIRDYLASQASGVGGSLMRVRPASLAHISFPLAPFPEQLRIVAEIEKHLTRLDAAVAALERARVNLSHYRAAVLEDSYRCVLEPSDGTTIDGKWPQVRFGDLLSSFCSGSTAVPSAEQTDQPILRSSSVRRRRVDMNDVRYVPNSAGAQTATLEDGDLLFVRLSGSIEYVGNCGLVKGLEGKRILFPDRLFRARLKDRRMAAYFEVAFATRRARRHIEESVKSTAGHKRISMGAITDAAFPLPSFEEQLRIVAEIDRRWSVVDVLESNVEQSLKRASRLRQSILMTAFEGNLVPQDPNDEPAKVLLDRIKSERARQTSLDGYQPRDRTRRDAAKAAQMPVEKATQP